ncbi:hypothetical protein BK749_13900 [Bacillus thuringiensis serovar vazensis]|uniref:Uncharacterized protein n=1 Tax=Bacillus thuringiensis serovar vazensis TaxID=180867 RepID=A0A243CVZ9_BACTU|nr:hypothetical protein BK749_13900 [Bacillus thuringiensis serovar vazensis]
MASPNRNSSPTYRRATPFTRLGKENSFRKYVKLKISFIIILNKLKCLFNFMKRHFNLSFSARRLPP